MKKKIIFKKEVNSTNTFLKQNYNLYDNWTILFTDHQTNGRGRITHNWYDEKKKNLLMSILLKDTELNNYLQQITLVVAVAVFKVLSQYISNISIKWPNDIYVDGKKICGILTEGVSVNNAVLAIIIGIGLNVNGVNYPEEIEKNTTSLKKIKKKSFFRKKLLRKIVYILEGEFISLKQGDKSYLEIIRNHFFLQDKKVSFERNNTILEGFVLGIDDEGKLIVDLGNEIVHLYSGEVTLKK